MRDALEIVADCLRFGVESRRRSEYHKLFVMLWTLVSIIMDVHIAL
jgi:hypothetical protein